MAWYRFQDGVLSLQLQVQPGSKADGIVGIQADRLKIRIHTPAVEGRANTQLIKFLADQFAVPKTAVRITRGGAGKAKTLVITNPRSWPGWFTKLNRPA